MKIRLICSLLFLILTAGNLKAVEATDNLLMVSEDEVSAAIKKEFVEQGRLEAVDKEFFGGQTVFQIENAQRAKILVEQLEADELQNKFSCKVEIFADGRPFAKTTVSGKFYVLGDIYVPAKEERHRSWGEVSGYREELERRNKKIRMEYGQGISVEELACRYCLSISAIRKIIYHK